MISLNLELSLAGYASKNRTNYTKKQAIIKEVILF
jgi:hypothetical protein